MWIVKLALNRPYTFIVLALLLLIAAPVVILRTPTDIFPNIDIPVISVGWQDTELNPEELEGRLTAPYEQPGTSLDTANAQVTAASRYLLRQLPPGILPPQIINFSASSVPFLQLGISGEGLSESQLNDYAHELHSHTDDYSAGIGGPSALRRQAAADQHQHGPDGDAVQEHRPGDLLNAVAQQNVVTPSGTIKIGRSEYDVITNGTPRTVEELAYIPLRQVNGTTIYLRDVASVSDGFQVQTNVVRQDGHRGVLISILKNGNASGA